MKKSQETTNYLDVLRNKLPKKGLREIARRLELNPATVTKVFNGEFENESVIDEAIKIVEETKERKRQLAERIKAL
uniref:HTH cro/C1-type domain-containing protein n=1 Tax=Sphingobacterium sp. (strain 21) TaxID=743722 RepID=F4C453_SPHS2